MEQEPTPHGGATTTSGHHTHGEEEEKRTGIGHEKEAAIPDNDAIVAVAAHSSPLSELFEIFVCDQRRRPGGGDDNMNEP